MAKRQDRKLIAPDTDLIDYLLSLPRDLRREAMLLLTDADGDAIDHAWKHWAHEGQLPPDGAAWSTWVLMAGRGFGKTLAGAKWLTGQIAGEDGQGGPPLHIALVGATLEDARRVMVEGRSGLMTVAAPWVAEWNPSLRKLRFVTGAEAVIFSGASPDMLRGPEHHLAWCDELAKWDNPQDCWDMLQFGLRLGERPRALVTTTPRAGEVLTAIMAADGTVVTRGRTAANAHTSTIWRTRMEALYAGTRLGRQELEGELLPEAGALWWPEMIAACRVDRARDGQDGDTYLRDMSPPVRFTRTLIAVDPPAGDGTCGIVACARDADGIGHVLADHSVSARSPEGWARAVADAAALHGTAEVVAEANQGGKMVAAVLRNAQAALRIRLVNATTGKSARAEPVAQLFEARKVRLHGRMPALEAQLCGLIAGGGYKGPGTSPDRADAMVWGLAEVMTTRGVPAVRGM